MKHGYKKAFRFFFFVFSCFSGSRFLFLFFFFFPFLFLVGGVFPVFFPQQLSAGHMFFFPASFFPRVSIEAFFLSFFFLSFFFERFFWTFFSGGERSSAASNLSDRRRRSAAHLMAQLHFFLQFSHIEKLMKTPFFSLSKSKHFTNTQTQRTGTQHFKHNGARQLSQSIYYVCKQGNPHNTNGSIPKSQQGIYNVHSRKKMSPCFSQLNSKKICAQSKPYQSSPGPTGLQQIHYFWEPRRTPPHQEYL